MARIRCIKPETGEDEVLAKACREARLLFILLWTIADDHGRFRSSPSYLKGKLFPYDEDLSAKTISEWLSQLALLKRIELYKVSEQSYGYLVNWGKHQRIDNASKSNLPSPHEAEPITSPQLAANLGEIPRDSASSPRAPDHSPLFIRKGEEGIGIGDSPRKSAAPKKATPLPEDFELSQELAEYATQKGILNVPFEFEHFKNHHTAKGSTFKDWKAAWRAWVGNGVKYQSTRASPDFQPPKKLNPDLYREQ